MLRRFPSILSLSLFLALVACTDAGLYAAGAGGPSGPDRAELEGLACVPLASGDAFPVKVLFAVQGGDGVDRAVVGQTFDAIQSVAARFSVPHVKLSLVAYHSVATGLQGAFVEASQFQAALAQYPSFSGSGPISLRAPLLLARTLLSGDMQTGCRGSVARTRYVVVLVFTSPDTSCANPAFNAGIDDRCNRLLPDESACSSCELSFVTGELKALAERYGAGEVVVQPVFIEQGNDPAASALALSQAAAIARQGGTEVITTDPASLSGTLNGLNYGSLQRALVLKRLIAFNRNAVSRAGALLADSDGDGVPDGDEEPLGLDPVNPDTDLDLLMDGVELRMGMNPNSVDTVKGCNPSLDTDGDRLNDCEERVLSTDACIGDSDGDALPDLVELLSGTNPLLPEDLADDDRDGLSNVGEVEAHTDPLSADVAYRGERGYGYSIAPAEPTEDGRACYRIRVHNVGLVHTRERPNAPYPPIPEGTNDVYLYMQVGRENDPRGTGIGSLRIEQLQFIPPSTRRPPGTRPVLPEEFVLGT